MPDIGQRGFEVEWYPNSAGNLKIANDTDADYSRMICEVRRFPNKGLAIGFAKRMAAQSIFGSAMVQPVEYSDKYDSGFAEWHELDSGRIEVSTNAATGGFDVGEC